MTAERRHWDQWHCTQFTDAEILKLIMFMERVSAGCDKIDGRIDWNWQWEVRGHWRNQFYAATNTHKPVFVEAYMKGPGLAITLDSVEAA